MRIGIGYDSHRFAEGRALVLGGVTIPHPVGLDGWSDADAAAHALIDAILGAAGQGDIGQMFPPDDPKWKDASSLDLLRRASLKVAELGLSLAHADITIITEQPKLAPYVDQMREKLADAAVVGFSNLSVKAKTNEGMGFIGRGEGIAVIAVALLEEART
jgi:2-C-methyl-D-erythritol 2,4-cyclodiphosphate synthase